MRSRFGHRISPVHQNWIVFSNLGTRFADWLFHRGAYGFPGGLFSEVNTITAPSGSITETESRASFVAKPRFRKSSAAFARFATVKTIRGLVIGVVDSSSISSPDVPGRRKRIVSLPSPRPVPPTPPMFSNDSLDV